MAEDNLRLGHVVIADSVNPIPITRAAWLDVAERAKTRAVEVEVQCSDRIEHRRRIDARLREGGGPSWQQVVDRDYRPWPAAAHRFDTARSTGLRRGPLWLNAARLGQEYRVLVQRDIHVQRMRTAWLWLVTALALHVIDEAMTGFLDVYNPTVRALRESVGWFPMPEFRFDVWATGLAALVFGLALLTPLIDRGSRAVRTATIVFAALMVLNGVAHLAGTIAGRTVAAVQFERPMPGAWSSPLLIGAAALYLARARGRDGGTA